METYNILDLINETLTCEVTNSQRNDIVSALKTKFPNCYELTEVQADIAIEIIRDYEYEYTKDLYCVKRVFLDSFGNIDDTREPEIMETNLYQLQAKNLANAFPLLTDSNIIITKIGNI